MRMEKKRIVKEDGRSLIYYHFPASANEEQISAFAKIRIADEAQEFMHQTQLNTIFSEIETHLGEEDSLV